MTLEAKYDRLTPTERTRAALAAKARQDRPELERLMRTAPTALYRMTDAATLDCWEATRDAAVAFLTNYHESYWRWVFLLGRRGAQARARRPWSTEDDDSLGAAWLGVAVSFLALERFCAVAGVKVTDLLRAWFGPSTLTDEIMAVRELFAPDILDLPEVQEEAAPFVKLLCSRWPDAPKGTDQGGNSAADPPADPPASGTNGTAAH